MDHSEIKHLPKVDHTPDDLQPWQRLLLAAADHIERYGWCQGRAYARLGFNVPSCMYGAICDQEHFPKGARAMAEIKVNEALGGFMAHWNDAPERTKPEVIAKLRAVALGG